MGKVIIRTIKPKNRILKGAVCIGQNRTTSIWNKPNGDIIIMKPKKR